MGLLDTVVGNATAAEKQEVEGVIAPILVPGEKISHAYKVGVRDNAIFSNMRLLVVDRQGISGRRISFSSYPYKVFQNWTMSTAGVIDIDGELKITTAGGSVQLNFGKKVDLAPIYALISQYVLLGK